MYVALSDIYWGIKYLYLHAENNNLYLESTLEDSLNARVATHFAQYFLVNFIRNLETGGFPDGW